MERDIGRWEAERMVRGLWRLGIGRIETILICPARLGRGKGIGHAVKRIRIRRAVHSLYLPGYDAGLIDLFRARGIEPFILERNGSIRVGGMLVRVFAPPYPPPEGTSVPVESVRVRYDIMPADPP